jgi:hypothetical protein
VASGRSDMADPSREVSVGSCALRLRSPALRVEPNRMRASALRPRRVSGRGARFGVAVPRAASSGPDQVGRIPRKSFILSARVPPSRGFATGSSRRCGFGPPSSADYLALQLSFGNTAIELGATRLRRSLGANPAGKTEVWFSKPHGRRLYEIRQASRRRRKPSRS